MINLQEESLFPYQENPVIWKTNLENNWGLFTNADYKLPFRSEEINDKKKEKEKAKTNTETPFYFTKVKQEVKGTTICTPKGYGIIQSVDNFKDTIQVKIQGIIHEFDKKDAVNEVPISILIVSGSMKTEQTFYFPASSSLQEVLSKLENSLESKENHIDIKLYLQGKELNPSNDTIEKLRIAPFTKIIATMKSGKAYKVSRFFNTAQGWGVGNQCVDGITFTTSKNIRLTGIGAFPFEHMPVISCVINLYYGEGITGEMLFSQETIITKNTENAGSKTPIQVLLDRPHPISGGEPYTITITFRSSGTCCYGTQGKAQVEGEDGTTFNFKYSGLGDHDNGTEVGSGLLPEFYYYA